MPKYLLNRTLHYPATLRDVERCLAKKPFEIKTSEAGEFVTWLPPDSLPWLLEKGWIEEVKGHEQVQL